MNPITGIGAAFVTKYGAAQTAQLLGKAEAFVNKMGEGLVQPAVVDLQKMLERDPELLGQDRDPTQYDWPQGQTMAIIMVSNRNPHPGILKAFANLYERDKMQYIDALSNTHIKGRNHAAHQFLFNTQCPWSFWWDDDIVPPFGDVDYHRRISENPNYPAAYIKLNPIARLMQAGRKLISGVYFGRRFQGRAQYSTALTNIMADNICHQGPRNLVEPVIWTAFGFTLVHRDVFTSIMEKMPELAINNPQFERQLGYKWRFFNVLSSMGEDSENSEDCAFCTRAGLAGHQTYVDHAVMPVHFGERGYSFANTVRPPNLVAY